MPQSDGAPKVEVDTSLPSTGLTGIDSPLGPGLSGGAGGVSTDPFGAVPAIPFNQPSGVQDAPPGGGASGTGARAAVVAFGRKFLGTPYVWGGTRPGGFDCSGLVQYVLGHAGGISLPRISYQQANFGQRSSLGSLQAGDLVAWDENSRNNGADHIAIYIGNGMILEAAHTGTDVRIRKISSSEHGIYGVKLHYSGDVTTGSARAV